jgi:hypothetical protein
MNTPNTPENDIHHAYTRHPVDYIEPLPEEDQGNPLDMTLLTDPFNRPTPNQVFYSIAPVEM